MIPNYLKGITEIVDEKNDNTKLKAKCTCGCTNFFIYKRQKTKDFIRKENEYEKQVVKDFGYNRSLYSDNEKNVYYIKTNVFGKIVKKVNIKDYPLFEKFENYVSVKCSHCGKEFVLFDENIHGYDASKKKKEENERIEYSNIEGSIYIILYYNDETINDTTSIDNSLMFGRIKIIQEKEKKKNTILDCECE